VSNSLHHFLCPQRRRQASSYQPYKTPIKDPPPCGCPGSDEGFYYTHLGAAESPEALREMMENRFSVTGKQLRLLEVRYAQSKRERERERERERVGKHLYSIAKCGEPCPYLIGYFSLHTQTVTASIWQCRWPPFGHKPSSPTPPPFYLRHLLLRSFLDTLDQLSS
jgi:hypothetical protein